MCSLAHLVVVVVTPLHKFTTRFHHHAPLHCFRLVLPNTTCLCFKYMSQKRYDQWAQIKSGGSIASPRETIAHSIPARSSPELVNATSNTWGPSTCLSHVDVSGVLADASVCSHFGIVGGVRQEPRVYYRYISRETFSQVFIYLFDSISSTCFRPHVATPGAAEGEVQACVGFLAGRGPRP